MRRSLVILALSFIIGITATAEIGRLECYQNNGDRRAGISFNLEKIKPGIYRLTQSGRGDYDTQKNVAWETESLLEICDGVYRPLRSRRIFKTAEGQFIKELRLDYVQYKRFFYFTITTPEITITKKFPLTGPMIDSTNLLISLAQLVEKRRPFFYLVTDLANIYKIKIIYERSQTVTFKGQRQEAVRVKMLPDLGIFDKFLENAIAPSFAWYTESSPCRFLRYEGKEVDRDSPGVITFLD